MATFNCGAQAVVRRRAATSTRKGVFNPDDSDRIKHTRIGVWDLYEEKTPEIEHVPGGSNIERYLQMKRDLPFVWTMLKDVGSIESCRPLLFFHVLLVLLGSLLPAATLFKGQLVKIVQVAVDTRTVNKTLLMQITVGLVVIKIVHKIIEHARNFIYYPLSSRLRQYYSLHLFHARARLDVPTFDDEAVQRQLHAVSQVQGNSVAWSTIDAISSLASLTLSIVTQASVLWSVLKDQPDGLLLAALTTLHTMSDMFQWQRSAGILHGVWAATTKDHDFIQLQGLKRIVSDFSHRKEFVAGNLTRYTISLFKTLVERLGDGAGNFDELHLYHRRREALTLWSLLKQPLSELPQVVFALRAVQQPSSIPVSLASLNLITQTTSTFSYKVYKVIQQTGTIADSVAAVRELYEILELPNKIPDGAIPFPEDTQKISSGISIEFKNVSFKYPGTDLYALREVSFKLQAGQLCVIVGVNGSGKSTILKLIVRLYDADEGQILVDGKDIKSLSLVDLRQAVSVLFQDYTHFPLSIRDNIGLGDPAHAEDDERISLAAKLGGSEEFITRLPDGLDTYLDRPVDDQYSRLPEVLFEFPLLDSSAITNMPRKAKVVLGPSNLSKVLESLTKGPKPDMAKLKLLKLTYATRNDHFGARHFAKNDLPRIRYANPSVTIEVNKLQKTKEESWKPEMVVELKDGTSRTLDLDKKWSSTIFEELMDLAGGHPWERWKRERIAAGLPFVDRPEPKSKSTPTPRKSRSKKSKADAPLDISQLFLNPNKKGAAAVLP
ncbi:hypothetical protein EUX98_g3800 [Antrodiella citrinella]|uniref:ABC transporter domain-containing protein n=1 Tax=Antrodiella citrinella TaxID=2447956 RepID=A0A4S4MYG4_9APHY|nr:hypothetical protein EUX98_g3800 [Antrodiella citrinella]